jgi:hypothetical protein
LCCLSGHDCDSVFIIELLCCTSLAIDENVDINCFFVHYNVIVGVYVRCYTCCVVRNNMTCVLIEQLSVEYEFDVTLPEDILMLTVDL